MTTISNLLHVYSENYIQVPSCEPPSGVSSPRFAAMYSIGNCKNVYVKLSDALAAIPGSEVVYGYNFGPYGIRQKWFKLPPRTVGCPCDNGEDWYGILRSITPYEDPRDPEICNPEYQEWCEERDPYVAPRTSDTYFAKNQVGIYGNAAMPIIPPYYRKEE